MSLENIIKYATNTPANTNPAVMSSVINSSFKETKEEILNEAMPKVIDLDKYNLNLDIGNGLATGGLTNYQLKNRDLNEFWDEVQADRPLNVKFTVLMDPIVNVRVNNVTTVKVVKDLFTKAGQVTQISFGATVDMGTGAIKVDVIIDMANGGTLTVKLS